MGGLNALLYSSFYGGIRKIALNAPAVDLSDSFTNRGFSSTVQKAYGTFYVAINSSTNSNPASNPSNWRKISYGYFIPDSYYAVPYVWRDAWNSGTTYAVNDIVCVSNSGGVSTYYFQDPCRNAQKYVNIPVKIWHGNSDTIIPISQSTNFQTKVNTLGGSVNIVTISGGTHLGSSTYDIDSVISFFNT